MLTAIVTGGGSGIGRATALRLAGAGYAVAVTGRTKATLQKVVAEIAAAGGASQSIAVTADVSKVADLEALVKQVMAAWGRIDVLVNNAGVAPSVPLREMTEAQWQEVLDTNLSSAFHTTRLVWPVMQAQRSGVIVNISSMAARDPFPGLGAYAIAKVGVNMLTLVTAREGEADGIRAVAIAPAGVNTPMFRGLVGENNVKTDEILRPEDVAAAIVEAVGPGNGALRYVSGETIYLHRRPA